MGRPSFTAELPDVSGPILISGEGPVSREYFLKFIAANRDLRTDLTAEGEMVVMAPAYSRSGNQNAHLAMRLGAWALENGVGTAYDSSAGFDFPGKSNRSPDASWVLNSRLAALSAEKRDHFLPLCPDFVAELRSKSDSVRFLRAKMTEYIANGARLGWLIDPIERTVHIYRPGRPVELLEDPLELSSDPELPGFVLDLKPIFDAKF